MAAVTAAVRSDTPSLPNARSRYVLTVASATNSSRPICAFVWPWAASRSTCTSRSVSGSGAGSRTRLTSLAATDGARTVSPRAAARTADASSGREASLSR